MTTLQILVLIEQRRALTRQQLEAGNVLLPMNPDLAPELAIGIHRCEAILAEYDVLVGLLQENLPRQMGGT